MAQFKQWFTQDLTESIVVRHCESVMFTGDDKGAVVGVRLYDNGAAYSGGGTVTGAVKRSDGGLVALTGTLSGNSASVVIPAAALAYPGPIGVHIILNQGGSVTTVLKAIYSVDDNSGAAVDPGTIIPSINDLITAINTAVASIPSDYSALLHTLAPDFSASKAYFSGDYVWYNGALYRFTADHAAGSWAGTDAKAAVIGTDLGSLKSTLCDNGIIDVFENGTYNNSTWRGITLTWNGKVAHVVGTATGGNFTSPNIFSNTNAFPENIFAGDVINVNFRQKTENVYLNIMSYVNGAWTNEWVFGRYDSSKYPIPSNATGLLMRLFVYNNATVNGNVEFSITKSAIVKNQEQVVPTVLPGSEGIAETIEALLTRYGIVILGKGIYELKKPITMPNNSAISGAGEATVIQAARGKDAIIAGASCMIENVKIHSNDGQTISAGTSAGIRVSGNYDTPPLKYNIKVSNVTIDGFSLAGIYGTKTGTWVGDSISAVNCTIFNCYAGIFLGDYSEFGRYTNIMCRDNYIGLYNKSGNNVFENCSFSNNTVGVYLAGDDGDNSRNNGHGSVIGCTINHSNNNAGFAVICRGIDGNGFVFDSCQIWYGKIQVENSTGITFNNCMLGAYNTNTEIINYTANDLFLMNCLFKVGATFSGSGGETHAINCFKFDGTPITV